jgi:hypothetical protein
MNESWIWEVNRLPCRQHSKTILTAQAPEFSRQKPTKTDNVNTAPIFF